MSAHEALSHRLRRPASGAVASATEVNALLARSGLSPRYGASRSSADESGDG
jgi:hypothetical protein